MIDSLLDRCRFPTAPLSDGRLDCALSGGPDSTALIALARQAGFEVTAWHINHGLRPEAATDEDLAAEIASSFGARFEVRRVDVGPGPDLEARAREARYAALPEGVCTGHTADDRAETVLLNIGRGAGLAGAAARFGRVNRPLLDIRRSETFALCEQLELAVVDDSMNHDVDYSRVAIRHRVIPALAEALGRDPVPLLNRHAALAAEAAEVIGALADEVDPTDAKAVSSLPRAVATETLRRWLAEETGCTTPPDAASIERILEVAAGRFVATEIEGGHRVARSRNRLRVEARR